MTRVQPSDVLKYLDIFQRKYFNNGLKEGITRYCRNIGQTRRQNVFEDKWSLQGSTFLDNQVITSIYL